MRKFDREADLMSRAAQSEQISAISTQFRRLGGACKGCHDAYREKLD
jgi:cytochrome c556